MNSLPSRQRQAPPSSPPAQRPGGGKWNERLTRFGYFVGAVLLHLVVFLLLATWVVFRSPPPPADSANFQRINIKPPAPPTPPPPPSGGEAANLLEPASVSVPPPALPSIVSVNKASSFAFNAVAVPAPNLPTSITQPSGSALAGHNPDGPASGFGSPFGSSATDGTAQLTGFLYDLKQTSDRKPTNIDDATYYGTIRRYVTAGWDESLFEPYYRSKLPIYANTLNISAKPSGEGPKAFGLEKEVQPAYWILHYHAKVAPQVPGEYRFAGFGDNVLAVRVNNENVLEAGFPFLTDESNLHRLFPFAFPTYLGAMAFGDPHLRYGKTFRIEPAETSDIDIIIGDSGGICCFFLLIQNMGNTYETTPDGTPVLPVFQIGSRPPHTFSAQEEHPPISDKTEPWEIVN